MGALPNEGVSGAVTGGAAGQQTGLTQGLVDAIAAAVQTAVSQATSQMQAQLNSLSENIDKVAKADSTDSDTGAMFRSIADPADPLRRLQALAEMSVADAISFRKAMDALVIRKVSQDTDHHGAVPPIAPRSASGPGTSAS